MKNKLAFLLILIFCKGLFAAEPADSTSLWKNEVIATINFTQTQFDNWTQGGENSWSWLFNLNGKFNYDGSQWNWANSFKIAYGQMKVSDDESKKSADEIKFESVLKYKAGIWIDPFLSVTGNTQMAEGFKYNKDNTKTRVSDRFDPAFFTESIGLGYEPSDKFKTRLGAAVKQTITNEFSELYAGGDDFKNELGAESVTDLNLKLNSNLSFTSKLEMFSNLESVDEIDVNWDNLFVSDVSKWLKVSFNFRLFYDSDISYKRQLMQILAVGVSYKLL